MPDEPAGVDGQTVLERVEVLPEGLPLPRHTRLQSADRHAFDLGHEASGVRRVAGVQGGEPETAVAVEDRGDPVDIGWSGKGIPEELGVVMGVRIDESGAEDEPFPVGRLPARLVDVADGHDPIAAHTDGALNRRRSGAVDDRHSANHLVQHVWEPPPRRSEL